MAVNYPVSKDTWAPKVDRDLSIGVVGDKVNKTWFNNWQEWIEALQDTLGLSILGGYSSVKDRLDDMPTEAEASLWALVGGAE